MTSTTAKKSRKVRELKTKDPASRELAYLFNSGPTPADPFPTCGPDPTEDLLGCESFGAYP